MFVAHTFTVVTGNTSAESLKLDGLVGHAKEEDVRSATTLVNNIHQAFKI